ncbi:hypothetical protein FRC04_007351 [Tulasnella sp. 424]|nr:hypothetical protein FRC04_007351 [Tulasnella sp. 424]KAG8971582.1 hypothetical protein FRC05_010928 [Tulasnella sp. 425]
MAGHAKYIPSFPPKFGEDKGEFFEHYDKIQDELDDEMVKRMKENLDGILTFAGLFAGVNSAFIALTLVLMQSDPLDDISSLLQQLVQGFRSAPALPSMSFNPSLGALITNGLFILSLSSALFASFFAVLGKQWLLLYRNRSGEGLEEERWEQLRRSLGAERWKLIPVLQIMLPTLIQASLGIFSVGLAAFLRSMSHPLSDFILVPLVIAVVLSLLTVGFSLWDASCPFRNPLSEALWSIPRLLWRIQMFILKDVVRRSPLVAAVIFRRPSQAKPQGFRFPKALWEWVRKHMPRAQTGNQHADRNGGASKREEGEVVASGVYILYDEEKGNAGTRAKVLSVSESPVPADAGHHRFEQEQWKSTMRTSIRMNRDAMINPQARFRDLIQRFSWLTRETETVEFLQVESIMRVIRITKDQDALYTAALNLRSITDLVMLAVVCANETTTRHLRGCYVEALKQLDHKHPSAKEQDQKLLRHALAFGTAFFHISLSAPSFDDFVTNVGISNALPPPGFSDMSPEASQTAGEICRRAQTLMRGFMNLQLRRLGTQPVELTSTTLAASALWYAINGIPHSQDIVYGARFREALATSQISWAGLGLLACVSNMPCRFHDVRRRKPYGMTEINWCRDAFLRVRAAYHLSKPTPELADAISNSFSKGRNLETNAILFISAWRLFAREDDGNPDFVKLGEKVLSAGKHLICALEKSIRSSETAKISQKFAETREMCFKAMLECMGQSGGEIKALKGVMWRHILTLKTATAYMEYIMGLKGPVNKGQNARAKEFMQKVEQAQIQNVRTALAMGKEYTDAKHAFEAVFSKFGVHDDAASVISDDSASPDPLMEAAPDVLPDTFQFLSALVPSA